jgi:N-acetylglutamate synthase/N-acetylornithine aminotransferase
MTSDTARFYDTFAPLYPLLDIFLHKHKRILAQRINAQPPGRLLEIGVGRGEHLRAYKHTDITGIDTSRGMLAFAEKNAPAGARLHVMDATFNRVTVDGDTSTNDTVYGLANGGSGVTATEADLPRLEAALTDILGRLAYMLVQDGEGATKVIHITVAGAENDADAEKIARTVGHSQLVKTAMYGKDANWGRIVAAIGRSGAAFAAKDVRVTMCGVELFRNEQPTNLDFDTLLKAPLEGRDITLDISVGGGAGRYTLLASDLTHDYVSVNADYRS